MDNINLVLFQLLIFIFLSNIFILQHPLKQKRKQINKRKQQSSNIQKITKMFTNIFPLLKQTDQVQIQQQPYEDSFENKKTIKNDQRIQYANDDGWDIPIDVHPLGVTDQIKMQPLQSNLDENIKGILNMTMLKNKKTYSKQYIPLGSIVDNAYLKQHQIKNLHFQHIYLNSVNQNALHKVIFKHNQESKQIRFYIPTFLRFSLIKLHSQDLKNITHIQNKNNLIIYINVYTKGLPKMLIDKLTKKTKVKDAEQQPKLLFRANRHLFEAKYYTSYSDYLIFMFNPFSQNLIQFEIMKNVMFAPFQQAQLILHIRINKKIFKLEKTKTLRIAKSSKNPPFQSQSPIKKGMRRKQPKSAQSIDDNIQQVQNQEQQEDQYQILHFNKIIMQFKIQKPLNVVDSFRFHKSIQFGNYGIMTNQINIHVGTYQSPQKKKQLQQEKASLNIDQEDLHQDQLEDISSMRLSIGLYKHPVTQLCTFFIPLMLAGGLTLLLFHLCDHSLTNQLEVLAIILVAYGAFIPQFRQRISMSRTVIIVDFFIVYNMVPAILCALQSINQSRHKKTYNSYQIISVIMYYISVLFLIQIYGLYMYADTIFFKKYTKQMVHNFDTEIFQTQQFQQDDEKCLSWFVLKSQKQRAFFCQRQDPVEKPQKKIKFMRKQTRYSSRLQDEIQHQQKRKEVQDLAQSIALQIRMSATTNKTLREVKQSQQQQQADHQHQQHEYLYKTKVIQNQRHVHSFQKILSTKQVIIGILILLLILSGTIWISWKKIYQILTFEDLNKNCIHDEQQAQRLARVQSIITKQQQLSKKIEQSWNDASVPEPDITFDENGQPITHHKKQYFIRHKKLDQQQTFSKQKSANNNNSKLRHHLNKDVRT